MNTWRNFIYVVAFFILGFPAAIALSNSSSSSGELKGSTLPSLPASKKIVPSASSGVPKTFKLNISVSKPEDLKVRQGETVISGQVLADRVADRNRLNLAKQELELSLKKIEGSIIFNPPKPKSVPSVASLPPSQFREQEADILDAQIKVREAQIAVDLHKRSLSIAPPKETSELEQVKAMVAAAKNKVDIQQRKIDAIATMTLPEAVSEHEARVAEQLQTELTSREAEERVAAANLEAASLGAAEEERQLLADFDRAKSNLELVKARLDTAREKRQREEYQHQLELAQRAEQQNQAEQAYSRQLMEAQAQEREKDYQLSQVRAKIQDVNSQLAQLATIKSPYSGVVRRVKYEGQSNQDLKVTITIATGSSPLQFPRTEGDRIPGAVGSN